MSSNTAGYRPLDSFISGKKHHAQTEDEWHSDYHRRKWQTDHARYDWLSPMMILETEDAYVLIEDDTNVMMVG